MYPSPDHLERLVRSKGPLRFIKAGDYIGKWVWPRKYSQKPVLVCEYAHAMGNSVSHLHKFMKVFESYPNLAGGYIWDMIDQGLLQSTKDGNEVYTYGGDWDDHPNDGYFCINGLFQPDLKPNPAALEVRKVYQPITVEPGDLSQGEILVKNKYSFQNLNHIYLLWALSENGIDKHSGKLPLPEISPGEVKQVFLPVTYLKDLNPDAEYHITISLHLNEETAWAPEDFKIAWDQFLYSVGTTEEKKKTRNLTTPLLIHPREDQLTILHPLLKVSFDTKTGFLKRISTGETPLIIGPLKPNFLRMLDNDQILEFWFPRLGRIFSLHRKWDKAETDMRLVDFSTERLSSGGVEVASIYKNSKGSSPLSIRTIINPRGSIDIQYSFVPRVEMLRFGLQAELSGDLVETSWFGRGPQETMPDRKQGGKIGIYQSSSHQIKYDYIHPQENGNRSDIRWVSFQDKTGTGLMVQSLDKQYFNFSLWPYTQQDLLRADHIQDLPERDLFTLNLDLTQRGTGDLSALFYGRDPETRLKRSEPYQFSFRLLPLV
jgi:beta-galactosidase